jgi:DNA-binding CsgD family transcriptional regulator
MPGAGRSPGETAASLAITEHTLKPHLSRICVWTKTPRSADLVTLIVAIAPPLAGPITDGLPLLLT